MHATDAPVMHPGQILVHDFMGPLGISSRALAAALHVSYSSISHLTGGSCRMTGNMAMRLGHYFGNSAWFWMNLQTRFDLKRAERMEPTFGIVPLERGT